MLSLSTTGYLFSIPFRANFSVYADWWNYTHQIDDSIFPPKFYVGSSSWNSGYCVPAHFRIPPDFGKVVNRLHMQRAPDVLVLFVVLRLVRECEQLLESLPLHCIHKRQPTLTLIAVQVHSISLHLQFQCTRMIVILELMDSRVFSFRHCVLILCRCPCCALQLFHEYHYVFSVVIEQGGSAIQ